MRDDYNWSIYEKNLDRQEKMNKIMAGWMLTLTVIVVFCFYKVIFQ